MNSEELDRSYQKNKSKFYDYINKVKKNSSWDIYTIINPTLVKNPYASEFPKSFFIGDVKKVNIFINFIKNIFKFYAKNIYLIFSYFLSFVLYKIYYKKERENDVEIVIDVFALVDKANKEGALSENYLTGIYEIFEEYKTNYTILLRPYQVGKNPFKLVKFFSIINEDKRDFIFEYELLRFSDFFTLFGLILLYPFKTLRLMQKVNTNEDNIFNHALVEDMKHFSFDSLTRYILGKNIAKIKTVKKIYSWSEFQVVERGLNFAIRKDNDNIRLIGCQFYLNYKTYFSTYLDAIDYEMLSSPHEVLVNGKYYIRHIDKVKYNCGVSLRYKSIFDFQGIKGEKYVLLLGSYIEKDTKYMLESVKDFENVIFKNHPAVDIKKFGTLSSDIVVSSENIYKLFENAKLVIGTASGTSVEAVACGILAIIIASQDNLTANPLVEYGKGKIWDIAFSKDDVVRLYNELIEYRKNNMEEIKDIASWYKDNFFIEPTEENILRVFELDKGKEV